MKDRISLTNEKLYVPNQPIIPFIEGDGIGPDIWKATKFVINAAVNKAYGNHRKIEWKEVYAGEKALEKTGEWLPEETIKTINKYLVAIKGLNGAIGEKTVTYDFERLMDDAILLKCSEFGGAIVKHM